MDLIKPMTNDIRKITYNGITTLGFDIFHCWEYGYYSTVTQNCFLALVRDFCDKHELGVGIDKYGATIVGNYISGDYISFHPMEITFNGTFNKPTFVDDLTIVLEKFYWN